jgi:predicted nucleic acid-binding protein
VSILVDSTVFIEAERKGLSARQALAAISLRFPGEEAAISVITLTELAHGAARADTATRKASRYLFIQELIAVIPSSPVTAAAALKAGEIDGESKSKGIHLALSDLLIGATALELGYKVATANLRHFQMIPGLLIVSF